MKCHCINHRILVVTFLFCFNPVEQNVEVYVERKRTYAPGNWPGTLKSRRFFFPHCRIKDRPCKCFTMYEIREKILQFWSGIPNLCLCRTMKSTLHHLAEPLLPVSPDYLLPSFIFSNRVIQALSPALLIPITKRHPEWITWRGKYFDSNRYKFMGTANGSSAVLCKGCSSNCVSKSFRRESVRLF